MNYADYAQRMERLMAVAIDAAQTVRALPPLEAQFVLLEHLTRAYSIAQALVFVGQRLKREELVEWAELTVKRLKELQTESNKFFQQQEDKS